MEKRAVLIVVSGRVQGVGYRWNAVEQAKRLGLSGYAMNLPDGRVELAVEGPRKELDVFMLWCRQGPPLARVEDVSVRECEPAGFNSFDVKRA